MASREMQEPWCYSACPNYHWAVLLNRSSQIEGMELSEDGEILLVLQAVRFGLLGSWIRLRKSVKCCDDQMLCPSPELHENLLDCLELYLIQSKSIYYVAG